MNLNFDTDRLRDIMNYTMPVNKGLVHSDFFQEKIRNE